LYLRGVAVLLVVHAVRQKDCGEVIRIISAQRTTGKERTRYKEMVSKTLADNPMDAARMRRLAKLATKPDSEIDFVDRAPGCRCRGLAAATG